MMTQKRGYVETFEASKGFCGTAEENLKPGTCILKTEAYAWISVKGCAWCMSMPPQVKLSACSGCKTLKYCSRKCQQNDWIYGPHAFECTSYRQIPVAFRKDPKPTVLLATRLTYKTLMNSNKNNRLEDRQAFQRLRHHHEGHTKEKLQEYEEMAQLVLLNLTRGKAVTNVTVQNPIENISLQQIVDIFCRINCNAFTMTDDECVPVGIGLFADGALFNHACDPNCVVSFQQQKMIVRTIQSIPKGQELTISYIDVFQSRKKRQQMLISSYFFQCQCDRCQYDLEEDLPLDGLKCLNGNCQGVVDTGVLSCNTCNFTRSRQEIDTLEATFGQEMELVRISTETDQINAMVEAWNTLRDKLVHRNNLRLAIIAREFGDITLRSGNKELALEYFLRELKIKSSVSCLSSKKLPGLGLAYFEIAKLYIDLKLHEEAKIYLKKALEVLDCVFGPENTVRQAAEATFLELQRAERDLLFGGAT